MMVCARVPYWPKPRTSGLCVDVVLGKAWRDEMGQKKDGGRWLTRKGGKFGTKATGQRRKLPHLYTEIELRACLTSSMLSLGGLASKRGVEIRWWWQSAASPFVTSTGRFSSHRSLSCKSRRNAATVSSRLCEGVAAKISEKIVLPRSALKKGSSSGPLPNT